MDWDAYRRRDGTIDLVAAWSSQCNGVYGREHCVKTLQAIEAMQPIRSRQVAALALAQMNLLEDYNLR